MNPKDIEQVNKMISEVFDFTRDMVIQKNIDYNNSLQNPNNIFSNSSVIEGIAKRIDDKLNRVKAAGINDKTVDSIYDIMGYMAHIIVRLRIDRELEQEKLQDQRFTEYQDSSY